VNNRNFWYQKPKFWSKIEILLKNRNFAQKSKLWSKTKFRSRIEILLKNRNLAQKSKLWSKTKFRSQIEILVKRRNVVKKFRSKIEISVKNWKIVSPWRGPWVFGYFGSWSKLVYYFWLTGWVPKVVQFGTRVFPALPFLLDLNQTLVYWRMNSPFSKNSKFSSGAKIKCTPIIWVFPTCIFKVLGPYEEVTNRKINIR